MVRLHRDMSKDTSRRLAPADRALQTTAICCTSMPAFMELRCRLAGCSTINNSRRRKMIDKDRIKGSAEQAKGKVKEWTGKALGDKKTEAEGKADQVKGKVQNAVGGLKDAMRGK
jgi:uncharacterized protein YjbJ (UPF0337 family)